MPSTNRINKARYWWAVLYPENMIEDWESRIGDIVQVPYAYCIHDTDTDKKSEHRKEHVHVILVFANTTTYKHAMSIFSLLSAEGKQALNTCEAVVNIRHCYDYLIHDTETCRKDDKHLYDKTCRVIGNNFDIGSYEQLTQQEKTAMLRELTDTIAERKFMNLTDFYEFMCDNFSVEYFDVFTAYNALLERLCKGNFQRLVKCRKNGNEGE